MNASPPALHGLRQDIAGATSPEDLNAHFRRAMRSFGFTAYAVGFVPDLVAEAGAPAAAPQPFLLLDWPAAWLELYAREGFAAEDVVVAESARTVDPFTWSEIRAKYPGASTRIFAAAAAFGWRDGFVIPVHNPRASPGERFGVASLAAGRLDGFGPTQRRVAASIVLSAFASAVALRGRRALARPEGDRLTARERDCLALVASGLDDPGIGEALGITRTTAHTHVERAKKRLGAKTRAQAVAVAMMSGLI